jgi:large subunit ribosomal protein L19
MEKCGCEFPEHLHYARPLPGSAPPGNREASGYTPFIIMSNIISKLEAEQVKKEVASFHVGDTVKVHTRVIEGDKERIQIFAGIVIARKGTSLNEAFTVRKISYGEGVERVFPLHSPKVAKIEVTKPGRVRRARLHYLRGRQGKDAMTVKDVVQNEA